MKKFIRRVVLPAILVAAAVGASYYLGWIEAKKLDEAQARLQALAAPPADIPAGAYAGPVKYLSYDEAAAEVEALQEGYLPPGAMTPIGPMMRILSQMKPDEAAELAAQLPAGFFRDQMLQQVARRWATEDTKAALDWVGTLDPADAQRIYQQILAPILPMAQQRLGKIDANVAGQYLDKLVNPNLRTQAINNLAGGLAQTDPAAALAWIGKFTTGDDYTNAVTALFSMVASPSKEPISMDDGSVFSMPSTNMHNPEAAVALLAKVDDPAVRATAIGQIAAGWAKEDPATAMQWAASLPATDGDARTSALNTIISGWAVNDPAGAAAFVEKSGDAALFVASAPAVADTLAKESPQAALQFVQGLPDGVGKDQALNNVLVDMAPQDFSSAWNIATSLPQGASRDAAMDSLVAGAVKRDVASALPLLGQIPDGPALQNATATVAAVWVFQDPQAASAWMNTLPAGQQRDMAVVQLISSQVAKDPAATLQWANTIATDAARADQVQQVVTTWAKTDPTAALDALKSANITDEQRANIAQLVGLAQAKAK